MDSRLPLYSLEELPEARSVRHRLPRALIEGPGSSTGRIAAVVTAIGALLASVLVVLLLY